MAVFRHVACVFVGALLVSGCNSTVSGGATGGSSGGAGSGAGGSTAQTIGQIIGSAGLDPDDYATALSTLTQLTDSYQPTAVSDLPSGQASYAGVVTLTLPSGGGTVLGDLSMDVDFGGQSFTGDVQDFVDTNLVAMTGSLGFVGGTLSGSSLSADADGTVAGLSLDYTVTGDFLGADAAALDLVFAGTGTGGLGVAEKH